MRRAGVVTFSNTSDNYGQVMQYWALQEALKRCGYDPFLIRFTFDIKSLRYAITLLFRRPLSLLPLIYNFFSARLQRIISRSAREAYRESVAIRQSSAKCEELHPRGFEEFRRDHFSIVEAKSLWQTPDAEILISGSDQIWAEVSDQYMLNFGAKEAKRISYASSFGRAVATPRFVRGVARHLKRYDIVTVRELSGLEICHRAGRDDARCMPDPTLLLEADDYMELSRDAKPIEGEYVLIYLLGTQSNIKAEELHKWAESEGYRVVYVASQGREDNFEGCYAQLEEWICLIRNAKYIFTNSYHGAIFSMIFNREFLLFPVVGAESSMNERITTLSEHYAVADRVYSGDLDAVKREIDYRAVNKKIADARVEAYKILKSL